jgi:signal transduction histidine kinase
LQGSSSAPSSSSNACYEGSNKLISGIDNVINTEVQFFYNSKNNKDDDDYNEKKEEVVVVVSIKDTGKGIDPEIMPRLFTKFSTKSFEGTGLGLYISKSIIEAHGERIWAENNKDGKGATFSFTLPIAVR